jgi:hypothetical protein
MRPRSPASPSAPLTPEDLARLRRSSGLSIDAQGRWWHEGEPFLNERLIALFDRGLGWSAEEGDPLRGEATLTVGSQWCYVGCDRTPFLVRRLVERGEAEGGGLWAALNTGARAEVRAVWLEGEVLFVSLAGAAPVARLSRHAQSQCAEWLVADGGDLALRVGGVVFPVGRAPL